MHLEKDRQSVLTDWILSFWRKEGLCQYSPCREGRERRGGKQVGILLPPVAAILCLC